MEAARVHRGWRQTDLADAVGVSQSEISQLEDNAAQRSDPDLADAIARALEIPVELFGQPDPAPQISHTLQTSLPRTTRNQMLASITLAHAHVGLLLGPTAAISLRDPDAYAHPHDVAERLRRRWSLPAGPVKRLLPVLEARGVICVYRDLSPLRVLALISTTERGQTLLFLDTSATRVDLAAAIAHELGHRTLNDDSQEASESDADDFAAAFLMPGREVLDDETFGPGMDLGSAATAWGVSPRALARRLRELRQITDLQLRALIREAKGLGADKGRMSLLGAPSTLVDAVRVAGGSHAAASKAFLAVEALRTDYLARSGR